MAAILEILLLLPATAQTTEPLEATEVQESTGRAIPNPTGLTPPVVPTGSIPANCGFLSFDNAPPAKAT
jgi:hypothetical protein